MTATRNELRSFGANLAVGIDALFLGSAFFIYGYRRTHAEEWLAAWTEAEWARVPFVAAVVLLGVLPMVYRMGRGLPAALLAAAASACLFFVSRAGPELVLASGSRAAQIAFGFFMTAFALHALVLAVAGLAARGSPQFRRLLWGQAGFAVLILPVVFCW